VRTRQANAGDVAYILEPDLKDGHGGIRDAQSLWWAECGGLSLTAEDDARSTSATTSCWTRASRSTAPPAGPVTPSDSRTRTRLLPLQARRSADAFMADIAAAARTVAWIADESWGRVGRRRRVAARAKSRPA
jgi:[protein-PII] uridylyltransferase